MLTHSGYTHSGSAILWQALTDAEYIMTRQPGDSRAQLRVKNINVSSKP